MGGQLAILHAHDARGCLCLRTMTRRPAQRRQRCWEIVPSHENLDRSPAGSLDTRLNGGLSRRRRFSTSVIHLLGACSRSGTRFSMVTGSHGLNPHEAPVPNWRSQRSCQRRDCACAVHKPAPRRIHMRPQHLDVSADIARDDARELGAVTRVSGLIKWHE
jgi:hypothetical protein